METRAPAPSAGLLTLHTTSNDTIMNITYDIPIQVLRLRAYRIQIDSAANALSKKLLYLELPIYNVSKLIDGNQGYTLLPILLDNAAVTLRDGLDKPINMGSQLHPSFRMRILEDSGTSGFTPAENLESATFQFEMEQGHL